MRLSFKALVMLSFSSAFLFANTAFAWTVISRDSQQAIWKAVQESAPAEGYEAQSLDIRLDEARVCYEKKGQPTLCALLVNPDRKESGLLGAGAFAVTIPSDEKPWPKGMLKTFAKALDSKGLANIWTQAKGEQEAPGQVEKEKNDLVAIAEYLITRNEFELAEKAVALADTLNPGVVRMVWLKIKLATRTGNVEEARKLIDSARRMVAGSPDIVWAEFELDVLTGHTKRALEKVSAVGKVLDSNDTLGCEAAETANFLEFNHKNDEALQLRIELTKALPGCGENWDRLVPVLLEKGRADDMVALCDAGLKKLPNDISILHAKSTALLRLRRYADQMLVLRKLYEITGDKRYVRPYSTAASLQALSPERLSSMERLYQEHPEDLMYRHALGVLSYYHGKYEQSIKLMDAVRKELPDDPRAVIYSAMSRYELGRADEAKAILEGLEKKGTDDVDLYYCLGIIWHKKDRQRALNYMDQYLAQPMSPDGMVEKRAKVAKFRDMLAAGEEIEEWVPGSRNKEKGCNSAPSSHAGLLGLFLALVSLGIRRRSIKTHK